MNLEKINILLADDDQDDRDFFDEALKQLPISSCLTTVNDGERLMAKLSDETLELPHVIFLDINMPQLTGMELAGLLSKDTKIVFTTAYSEYAAESYTFQTIDYL